MTLTERARIFATAAHAACEQKRKYTGEPYIVHPAAVVTLLMQIEPSPEMIAAAWLHDTVEDTGVTLDLVAELFGPSVARYVEMLTDVRTRQTGGERIHRKNANLLHSAAACPEAQSIKLCDLIDNSRSVLEHDPVFTRAYMVEMRRLLVVLTQGDPRLYAAATQQCDHIILCIHRSLGDESWYQQLWQQYEAHLPLSVVLARTRELA
ncbi:HD domain-containing protein [Dickeya undicola]|uniref:HD domain-containing protein n=1 Tax=Dickeya undicola TaxID=1577887 RepID=UPI000532B367|nr:HD domain-containing protein [Dickeya undicola]